MRKLLRLLPAVLLVSSLGVARANDDCLDAIVVIDGSVETGTTVTATLDGEATCGSAGSTPDRWYVFTVGAEDVFLTASSCGSSYDTVLSIHTDCPGTAANQLACNDDTCGLQSGVSITAQAGETYYIRISGFSGDTGDYTIEFTTVDPGSISGPDVTYSDCTSITNWGQSGGIRGYSLGSFTCNIGDANLQWGGTTPLLGMNGYRISDGRIEQIGQSWLKNGTGAAAGSGCGLPCNGQGGSVLGAGCLDVYGSGFNGSQGILGKRSDCNGFTGTYPGQSTGTGPSVISERLQIAESDLSVSGAQYFLEGVYVAPDDAAAGNALNNASYKPMSVTLGNFNLSPTGTMQEGFPAIYAWQDHGLGAGVPDPDVTIIEVDVPDEGRFIVGSKATDLGGSWRYDYAIFNLNSDRSAGSFSVPATGAISGEGFHDVDYHSGEIYDNTDWTVTSGSGDVTWSSPETFVANPNSNALRFGTMYSYWFESTQAPTTVTATLGLFKTGSPDSITFAVTGPEGGVALDIFSRGDCNGDASFNIADGVTMLSFLFAGGAAITCDDACDANDDGMLDIGDPVAMLDTLFSMAGPLPSPHPGCGADTTLDTLTCDSFAGCP